MIDCTESTNYGVSSLLTTRALKEKEPAVVGVPLIWPVEELIVSPGGSANWAIDQVCGGTPAADGESAATALGTTRCTGSAGCA